MIISIANQKGGCGKSTAARVDPAFRFTAQSAQWDGAHPPAGFAMHLPPQDNDNSKTSFEFGARLAWSGAATCRAALASTAPSRVCRLLNMKAHSVWLFIQSGDGSGVLCLRKEYHLDGKPQRAFLSYALPPNAWMSAMPLP
jgi:hypothetical protein